MKSVNDLKIGIRLSLFISIAVILILSILGVYIYHIQRDKVILDTDTNMTEQVNDLTKLVQLQIKERQEQVSSAMNVASEILNTKGKLTLEKSKKIELEVTNQANQEVKKTVIPSLNLDKTALYNNTSIVDKITELTRVKATIFQKIEGGYVRISTSILKADGSRATNTFIPDDSPVIKAIEQGNDYNGRAIVIDDWYLTSYRPIKIDNDIVGILFVGMPEKDMKNIKEIFNQKKYLQSGYPYIVGKDGKLIVHPTKEGTTLVKEDFFVKIAELKNESGKTYYSWEGQKKIQYSKYVKEIDSYIVVSIYENEMIQMLNHLRNILIIAVILSIFINL